MHCHCCTNNRVPQWTFTDPCKPEVRPGAWEESASPSWLAAPAMNARDTTKVYIWRLDTGCGPTLYRNCHSHNTPGKRHNNTWVESLMGNCYMYIVSIVNREVEQTQLVRVRVRVTSLFVDDVIITCVPRTCATRYTSAWTCKMWSTRLSLRVETVNKWRWESPFPPYQTVLGFLENIKIKQKRLESAKLASNSDQMLVFWFHIFYTYTYVLKRVCSTKLTSETSRVPHTYAYTYKCGLLNLPNNDDVQFQ